MDKFVTLFTIACAELCVLCCVCLQPLQSNHVFDLLVLRSCSLALCLADSFTTLLSLNSISWRIGFVHSPFAKSGSVRSRLKIGNEL